MFFYPQAKNSYLYDKVIAVWNVEQALMQTLYLEHWVNLIANALIQK